jgi:hypothetical protein
MANCRLLFVPLLALAMAGSARGDDDEGDRPRLPAIGRPDFFDVEDGPIGAFQTPAVRASPTDVQAEDPITLTIRVTAAGKVPYPPKQIRLEKFPEIAELFYVEYPDDPVFQVIDNRTWEFICTLKPRRAGISAIPGFPFAYFVPGLLPAERGYQVHRTASIPITVRPRAAVQSNEVVRGVESQPLPDCVFEIAEETSVLSYPRPIPLRGWVFLGGVFILGQVLDFIFIIRARSGRDAKQQATARRSSAAKHALRVLERISDDSEIDQAPTVVTRYLRERFDFDAQEPTPSEVRLHLESVGCDPAASTLAGQFFKDCDAARYAHLQPTRSLVILAREVILTLEAGPCRVSTSS